MDYEAAGRLDLCVYGCSTITSQLLIIIYVVRCHLWLNNTKHLVARGIPAENIHSEAFGTGGVKLS